MESINTRENTTDEAAPVATFSSAGDQPYVLIPLPTES